MPPVLPGRAFTRNERPGPGARPPPLRDQTLPTIIESRLNEVVEKLGVRVPRLEGESCGDWAIRVVLALGVAEGWDRWD